MLVYLVAAVEALLYLSAIPLCGAFTLSTRNGLRFGVGLGAFERRFALRRAYRNSLKSGLDPKRKKRSGPGRALRILASLRGAALSLRGSLGLGDAAATALACGALRALASALGARSGTVEIFVAPLFDTAEPRVELQGMLRVRSGQIMTAAAKTGVEQLIRRIAKWTNIPSKV